jgi:hypothetical protein
VLEVDRVGDRDRWLEARGSRALVLEARDVDRGSRRIL